MANITIIDTTVCLNILILAQLYLVNLIRIKLQVIFISDLLCFRTSRVKDCFWEGEVDKFAKSRCNWPIVLLDKVVILQWK